MTDHNEVEERLKRLDELYNSSNDGLESLSWSNTAILILSGWIEDRIDEIVRNHYNSVLTVQSNKKLVDAKLKDVYSYRYSKVRSILIYVLGIIGYEKFETHASALLDTTFKDPGGVANYLLNTRDRISHSYRGFFQNRNPDAPSKTLIMFREMKDSLEKIDDILTSMRNTP